MENGKFGLSDDEMTKLLNRTLVLGEISAINQVITICSKMAGDLYAKGDERSAFVRDVLMPKFMKYRDNRNEELDIINEEG